MSTDLDHHIFNKLVRTPASLDQTDLEDLNRLSSKYPYAQVFQFARKKLLNDPESASIFAPDRNLLELFVQSPNSLIISEFEQELLPNKEAQSSVQFDDMEAPSNINEVQLNDEVDETQQLILESIAATDFFALEDKVAESVDESPSSQEISRYDDDQMPYTFLWWLNKTRKEHAETYQPYVSFKLDTTEQIKTSKPVDQAAESQIADFDLSLISSQSKPNKNSRVKKSTGSKSKEEELIDRFINDEPQISPPSAEKMGTENKARKSAEDALDLVSETLAQIYTEQMLLDKAIETYRKLSLKFPEKSTYFADQISLLERKKN